MISGFSLGRPPSIGAHFPITASMVSPIVPSILYRSASWRLGGVGWNCARDSWQVARENCWGKKKSPGQVRSGLEVSDFFQGRVVASKS